MKQRLKSAALIILGCVLYALAYNLFFEPFRISPGGVSGLAMVLEELDSEAFLIVTGGHQIFGDGFLPKSKAQ